MAKTKLLQRMSLTLLMLASNVSNTQWCSPPERKKHGLVLEGQAGKVDGHGGGQTPSPGLPHPSFGGWCQKAVLGVWQVASGLFGIFHSSHHHHRHDVAEGPAHKQHRHRRSAHDHVSVDVGQRLIVRHPAVSHGSPKFVVGVRCEIGPIVRMS